MHIPRRHWLALAATVLGAAACIMPVQAAAADPAPPSITISHSEADLYGAPGDVDITVTSPPTTDAYIEVYVNPAGALRFTDDSGNLVSPAQGLDYGFSLGWADTNGNGIHGAPLSAGVIHLHVAASYPATPSTQIAALIRDGATGDVLAGSLGDPRLTVHQGSVATEFQEEGNWHPADHYDPLPVTPGASSPLTVRIDTAMSYAAAPSQTRTRVVFTAQQIADAGYTAPQLVAAMRLQYSADGKRYDPLAWDVGADGSLTLEFPTRTWTSHTAPLQEYLRIWTAWGLPIADLHGVVQTWDPDGQRQYTQGAEDVRVWKGVRPASLQAAFYGRDAAGHLYRYQGKPWEGTSGYAPRRLIGGGWGVYDTVTALAPLTADDYGDAVARDASGVLWLYRGTGNTTAPFAPRVRVGAGWGAYNTLAGAGDLTGDGKADLLARDGSGVLWLYRGTSNTTAPFAPRVRVGAGWGAYNTLTGGSDLTGDGKADLLARDGSGVLWLYRGTGNTTAPYLPRVSVGTGWQGYTHILGIGDLLVDGHADILATDPRGNLWYYRGTGTASAPYGPRVTIGPGWGTYNLLF